MPTRQPRDLRRAQNSLRRRLHASVGVTALFGALAAHAAAPYRGRPVDAVLGELATTGEFQLIYTSAVVPSSARVAVEPTAGPALEVVAQVLAPLGLKLQRVEGRIYSVVPQAGPDHSRTTAATAAADPRDDAIADIVVTASRYTLASDVPQVHAFLSQQEVDALPRLGEDVLKAVHRLPGAASNGLPGLAHMRGGGTNGPAVIPERLPPAGPVPPRRRTNPSQRGG